MSSAAFSQFVKARRAFAPALSPDGSALAFVSDVTGYPEAYLDQGPGMDPLPLTEFRERVGRLQWTPDGRRIILDSDLGGDERWVIRSVRPNGRDHRSLSHEEKTIHQMGRISPDGRWLTCAKNRRDPASFDLVVIDIATAMHRVLLAEEASDLPGAFSPDGRWTIALRTFGSFRQELLLVDVTEGRTHRLTPPGERHRYQDVVFDRDGESLLLLTDRGRDYLGFARLSLETREIEWIHAPDDRDVELLVVSGNGRRALLSENVRGWSRLLLVDPASGEVREVEHARGVVAELDISADGSRAAFSLSTPTAPSEVYCVDPVTGEVERATHTPRNGVPEENLVRPEEVVYPSFDGTELSGWLYLPRRQRSRRPAVVKVHGGPESQARPVYDPVSQYLLSQGFAVFEPNVRGSTGYGRKFAALDDGRKRFDAVKDLAATAEFLRDGGKVDGNRLSLLGSSYGGFMVLAGLAFFPELFVAGVDIVGIANFRTFLERTGAWRRGWRIEEYGDPVDDAEFLDELSPVNHADRIRAPLLVIQGANDPRVPEAEAEQIVHAVGGRGGIAQYLRFADEGHGLVKLPNRLKAYEAIVNFLSRYGT